MGIVLQDPFLFQGTVRDNIVYGNLDATDNEVETAARAVNAHEMIMRLTGWLRRQSCRTHRTSASASVN